MKARRKSKPIEVKRGNVSVKIYTENNRVGEKTYTRYALSYYLGAQRRIRKFACLDEAKREAAIAATKMANAEHAVLKLTSTDRAVYLQAKADLDPLGIELHTGVSEYVAAKKKLPEGISLVEAVNFFLKRHPAQLTKRTVREVLDELIESKRKAGKSDVYLKDLESRIGRFAKAFSMNIGEVSGEAIEKYLHSLDVAPTTVKNHIRNITTLFNFAVRRKYLPKDAMDELALIEHPAIEPKDIEVFSPAEMKEIFAGARLEMIPWLAIGAFSGIRNAELQRLDWSDINFEERFIEIKASKAKTASRRLAPLPDNLVNWLTPFAQKSGPVSPFVNISNQIEWLVDDINNLRAESGNDSKFVWKRNGLRHSFVSYRSAIIKDIAKVAYECGNSPNMIHEHYRQLVTPSEAENWFGIEPTKEGNVLKMPQEAFAA